MSVIQGNSHSGSGYSIANSLRLRSSASAYLSRTPASAGNRTTWTFSANGKRGALGLGFLLCAYQDANNFDYLYFTSNNTLIYWQRYTGTDYQVQTTAVYRDPSAHMHILLSVDQNAVASERVKIILNGVRQSVTGTGSGIVTLINVASQVHYIARSNAGEYFDGYLSEINFIDGQALSPYSFGEFSSETGQWVPKKYTGTYGTNGFYLPFNDGTNLTNLCLDRSGNGNNWTATNVSLTAGATYDWVLDTPTNNYAVVNPLDWTTVNGTVSWGNLKWATNSSSDNYNRSSIPFSGSTKGYAEFTITNRDIDVTGYGVIYIAGGYLWWQYQAPFWQIYGTGGSPTSISAINNGDVVMLAVDGNAGKAWFGVNGVWLLSGNPSNGTPMSNPLTFTSGVDQLLTLQGRIGSTNQVIDCNFGQRPFTYTPPSGFKSLCTANLPAPTIPNPKQHFDTVLATGANIKTTSEAVFPSNFFEWIKDRANVNNHQLIDTVRGSSAVLQSNTTGAETTYSVPSGSSVGWVWKAGGAAVSNTAGSIASQVSANTTAGFSVVTYTGTGTNATVGHGLGVAPKMVIIKNRGSIGTAEWLVGHSSIGFDNFLLLNSTQARATAANRFNNTSPTSSVFSIGTIPSANTETYVTYCFAEVPGFSKIGSYTGNGATDGPFVYCGFKPRFVLIKRTDATSHWRIVDTARSTYNANGLDLYPNLSNAEGAVAFDFLSNGFKPRVTDTDYNANGGSYIFYAVAESPFNYSTAR